MLYNIIYIGIGGALGAVSRFGVNEVMIPIESCRFRPET